MKHLKQIFCAVLLSLTVFAVTYPLAWIIAGTVVKPNTFVNATVASATEVNADFDTLYTLVNGNIDNDNVKGAAGIVFSKLDSATVAGVTATQTLTNKTLTTPVIASFYQDAGLTKLMTVPNVASDTLVTLAASQSLSAKTLVSPIITTSPTAAGTTWTDLGSVTTADINGGTIDGVTIGATVAPTVTNLGVVTTADINGGTIDGTTIGGSSAAAGTFTTLGASGISTLQDDVKITALKKLYYDGGGNTYIYESTADQLDLVTGGSARVSATNTYVGITGDLIVNALSLIRLDGLAAGDTYIRESAADVIELAAGNTVSASIRAGSIAIPATNKIYLDGIAATGNTYISESSGDTISLYAGGTETLAIGNLSVVIPSSAGFYWDGGGNTYTTESAADRLDFISGGLITLRLLSGDIYLPNHTTTASGANAYIDATTGKVNRSTSSIRYKTKIKDMKDEDKLYQLRPITYSDKQTDKGPYFGFSAEEVALIYPEVIDYNAEGKPEYVFYERLTVPIIAEIKKLNERIKVLEAK